MDIQLKLKLINVINTNNQELLEQILDNINNINITDENNWTILYWAVHLKNYEMVKLILKYNPDVNIQNNNGFTPLHVAVDNGNYLIVQLLIDNGANPNLKDNFDTTPLLIATEYNDIKLVILFLENGASATINQRNNEQGWSPLHMAAFHGNYEIAEILLQYGADKNIIDFQGWTPLHLACESDIINDSDNQLNMVNLLIQQKSNINIQDNFGQTPLYMSIRNSYWEVAKLLLGNGADKNIATHAKVTCLDGVDNEEIRKLLLEKP